MNLKELEVDVGVADARGKKKAGETEPVAQKCKGSGSAAPSDKSGEDVLDRLVTYEDPVSGQRKFVKNKDSSFKSSLVAGGLLESIALDGDRHQLETRKDLGVNLRDMDRSLCFVLAMYRKLKEMTLISDL